MFFINPFIYAGGGDFESIATVTVGAGGAANIEFASIPSTFQHLQIRLVGRMDKSATSVTNFYLTFNSDTTTNNSNHILYGDGSSAAAYGAASLSVPDIGMASGASASSSVFGASVIDILDYANTSKNTTSRSFTGLDLNGSGTVRLYSAAWLSTSAVTSVKLYRNDSNWVQHTTAALYGVKAP
jgi:hypothetical protein